MTTQTCHCPRGGRASSEVEHWESGKGFCYHLRRAGEQDSERPWRRMYYKTSVSLSRPCRNREREIREKKVMEKREKRSSHSLAGAGEKQLQEPLVSLHLISLHGLSLPS